DVVERAVPLRLAGGQRDEGCGQQDSDRGDGQLQGEDHGPRREHRSLHRQQGRNRPGLRVLLAGHAVYNRNCHSQVFSGGAAMPVAGPLLILAVSLAAPAPPRVKDRWVGIVICCKTGSPETYRRNDDGTFELYAFRMRYLDLRCVDEQDDMIAVQHDDQVFWLKKESALRPREAITHFTEILEKNPEDQRAISCRGWAYLAAGEFDRGLKDAEEAVRLS